MGKRFAGVAIAAVGLAAAMIGTAGLAGAVGTTTTTSPPSTTVTHRTTTTTTQGRRSVTPAVQAPVPATVAPALGKPPGNNGTIKIDGSSFSNANHPHVTCTFDLAFYGFDTGTQTATVSFTAQPPSGQFTPVAPTEGPSVFTFTGSGPGNSFDASRTYALDTTGLTANAQQGYHIKVSVDVTGAQGSDDKSKVFWYEPCTVTTTTTGGSTTTTAHGTTTTAHDTTTTAHDTTTTAHGTTTTAAAGATTTEPVAAAVAGGSTGASSPAGSAATPAAPGGGAATISSGAPPLPTGAGTDLGPFSPASFSSVTIGPWILLIVGGLLLFACGTVAARRGSRAG
jgi:hypothetical protein